MADVLCCGCLNHLAGRFGILHDVFDEHRVCPLGQSAPDDQNRHVLAADILPVDNFSGKNAGQLLLAEGGNLVVLVDQDDHFVFADDNGPIGGRVGNGDPFFFQKCHPVVE